MLFDAHARAFAAFGGVPRRGIYDKMKTAVDKVGRGKERAFRARNGEAGKRGSHPRVRAAGMEAMPRLEKELDATRGELDKESEARAVAVQAAAVSEAKLEGGSRLGR